MNNEIINYFLDLTKEIFSPEDQKPIENNLQNMRNFWARREAEVRDAEIHPGDKIKDYRVRDPEDAWLFKRYPHYTGRGPEESSFWELPEFLREKELARLDQIKRYGPPDPNLPPNWAEIRRQKAGLFPSEYERARKLVEEQEKDPEGEMSNVPFDKGGQVLSFIQHLQTGGEALDADTTMEVGNVPMGIVSDPDGAPAPFNGGTGVEDDLDMEVESGSYVLNAEAVQLVGISDINEVIRDAYSIAMALGKQMPEDYDPQNKVPIRISNGEAVIPKVLVDIIGLDKLEKWNNKGLDIRKQQEEQPQPQEPQIATEAPPMQSPNMPMGFNQGSVVPEPPPPKPELEPEEEVQVQVPPLKPSPPKLTQEEFLASQSARDERRNDRYRELVKGELAGTEDIPPLPISKPELPTKVQSRGMRNNSPFNILVETNSKIPPRTSRVFAYHGTTGVDTEKVNNKKYLHYSVFDNIDNGLRAGASVLRSDKYNGKTLKTIIKTFSSTDQESYLDFVAEKLNIKPDTKIYTKNDAKLEKLMKAMLEFESTAKALEDISDEQIKNAIKRSKKNLPDSKYYTGKSTTR
jgi:hypothetical protein